MVNTISEPQLRNLSAILMNIDLDELEAAGVITPGAQGGSDWERFNKDPLMFILKLNQDRRRELVKIINRRLREC